MDCPLPAKVSMSHTQRVAISTDQELDALTSGEHRSNGGLRPLKRSKIRGLQKPTPVDSPKMPWRRIINLATSLMRHPPFSPHPHLSADRGLDRMDFRDVGDVIPAL